MAKVPWTRLIRFESTDGRILHGDVILPDQITGSSAIEFDIGKTSEADRVQARILKGDDVFDTTGRTYVTDEVATVKRLLGPLTQKDVPILRCVGLNYAKHSE